MLASLNHTAPSGPYASLLGAAPPKGIEVSVIWGPSKGMHPILFTLLSAKHTPVEDKEIPLGMEFGVGISHVVT